MAGFGPQGPPRLPGRAAQVDLNVGVISSIEAEQAERSPRCSGESLGLGMLMTLTP